MKSIKKRFTAARCWRCCYFAHIVLHTHRHRHSKKKAIRYFCSAVMQTAERIYAELVQNLPKMNKYVIMRASVVIVIVFVSVALASGRQRRHLHLRATSALATKFRTTQEQRRRRVATSPTRGSRLTALLRRGLCQNVAAATLAAAQHPQCTVGPIPNEGNEIFPISVFQKLHVLPLKTCRRVAFETSTLLTVQ